MNHYDVILTLLRSDDVIVEQNFIIFFQIIESVLVLMEEFDLAPDGSSTLQKCFIVSLRHITASDLEDGKIGHVIVREILTGISYKYSGVIDSTMDVLTSFYNSLPDDLVLSEATMNFLLTPLDGLKQLR